MFRNRADAAHQLAQALSFWKGKRPLILAIPRGAVPMGRIIADELAGDLDVALTRKLRAPGNPELAVGAIAESGWSHVADYAARLGVGEDYLRAEKAAQLEAMRRRRAQYTAPPISPAGRIAIVIDDGLATGATMIAALHALREKAPERLVCAVPVAPPDTLDKIAPLADEVVCLLATEDFSAVGQFYADFDQVEDEEVIAALARGTAA